MSAGDASGNGQARTLQQLCDNAADILEDLREPLTDHPYNWGQVTAVQDFIRGIPEKVERANGK